VPDAPTSPGENLRVLPQPFARVPEKQLEKPHLRSRQLFDEADELRLGEPARAVLEASMADLQVPAELRELGMAVYLDRPLGASKQSGEVDRTPLVSYEAFSRAIALKRLAEIRRHGWLQDTKCEILSDNLKDLRIAGVAVSSYGQHERPGVVALADARKASEDFLFLRTTRQSLTALLRAFDLSELQDRAPATNSWLAEGRDVLLIRNPIPAAPPGSLIAFDVAGNSVPLPRVEFWLDPPTREEQPNTENEGIEYPYGKWHVANATK